MKKETTKSFILLALLFFTTTLLYAIPAIPDPVVMTQPDGKTLTVLIKGDERIHWYESMDGYTLLYNKEGYLSYAQLDEEGNLQPSERIATDIEKRDIITSSFLNHLGKNMFYSETQVQLMLKVWEFEEDAAQKSWREGRSVIGEYKTLCAFVQFPEKAMIKSMSEFEGLMNQLGYTGSGAYGSVRDYFKESSYNQFDLIITLCGIYTAPQSEVFYAGSQPGDGVSNCATLARWAAQQIAADPNINFADYDSNNDGIVDGFHFIFAGRCQASGGGAGTIWSHKSQFNPPVSKNGKTISIYSCSPELSSPSAITTIGVICHEMTHAFGAPDFYDTNYEIGGSFNGTGNWDIMASGSHNGSPSGNRPPHHNMYTKVQFGWVEPIVLNSKTKVTGMPNSAENPVAYRINTPTTNEYFLLENRQRVKFDSSVPGDGLIIYHVHAQIAGYINSNTINTTHPQRMYPVCASRTTQVPNSTPNSYGNINTTGCPFPGSSNQTFFTDSSIPAMKSWANANVNKPIINIAMNNRLISFEFMYELTTYNITATTGSNGTVTPTGVTPVYQGGSQEYSITPDTHYERDQVLINGTNNPDAVTSGKYMFMDVNSNQTIHAKFSPKSYTVTFNANGGNGTMEPQSIKYGAPGKLKANNFTKPSSQFIGWNTIASGNGTFFKDQDEISLNSDRTLYAQWSVSITEQQNHPQIQIIPNPANDFIDLRFTIYDLRFETVEFYNIFGQLVKNIPIAGEKEDNLIIQRISIADLTKGIYFVKVGENTVKLVVQ